jgi:hypothetical protein
MLACLLQIVRGGCRFEPQCAPVLELSKNNLPPTRSIAGTMRCDHACLAPWLLLFRSVEREARCPACSSLDEAVLPSNKYTNQNRVAVRLKPSNGWTFAKFGCISRSGSRCDFTLPSCQVSHCVQPFATDGCLITHIISIGLIGLRLFSAAAGHSLCLFLRFLRLCVCHIRRHR